MHTPTVSIITPAKNAATWIGGAISSVRKQSFPDWEMIVVDDGSSDSTTAVAHAATEGDPRVSIQRSQGDPGAGGARNAALGVAKGRYIAFLDADDLWDADKLAVQLAAMEANRWVFSWTSYRVQTVGKDGALSQAPFPVRHALPNASRRDVLAKRAPIGCLTAIYDTQAFGKVPMSTIPKRQDFVLWAQLMAKAEAENWAMGGVNASLATYRLRQDSLSGNKLDAARMQWKALTQHCGVGTLDAASLFASYALRGVWDRFRVFLSATN